MNTQSSLRSVITKITALTLFVTIAALGFFEVAESQQVYAASSNAIVTLNVTTGISITSPGNTNMSTTLGVSSNTAVATTTWSVTTNDSLGYTLSLAASTAPAMQSGSNFVQDYSTTTAPSLWSVSSGGALFGFSVFGSDVNTTTWGTGTACSAAATSSIPAALKYFGFYTVATTVASRSSTTTSSGVPTNVCYAVQQNNFFIPSGTYTATITATATSL